MMVKIFLMKSRAKIPFLKNTRQFLLQIRIVTCRTVLVYNKYELNN